MPTLPVTPAYNTTVDASVVRANQVLSLQCILSVHVKFIRRQLFWPVIFLCRTAIKRKRGGVIPRMHVRLCRTASRTCVLRSVLHRHVGRLVCPRRLTTPRTTRPSTLVAGSCVRASLQHGGQLARPHRFKTPRPSHLSAPTVDPPVIDVSFTVVIINSAVDNFWHDIM